MEKNEGRRRETLPPSKEEKEERRGRGLVFPNALRGNCLLLQLVGPGTWSRPFAQRITQIHRGSDRYPDDGNTLSRGMDHEPISSGHFAIFHSGGALAPCNPILRLTTGTCRLRRENIDDFRDATRRKATRWDDRACAYSMENDTNLDKSIVTIGIDHTATFLRVQPTLDNGACADNILLYVESSISEFCFLMTLRIMCA